MGLSTKASPPNPKKSNDVVVHMNGVVKEKCSGGSSFKDGVQRNEQFCVKIDGIRGEVVRSGVDVCVQLYENDVVGLNHNNKIQ